MKFTAHIPTQSFGFLEIEAEENELEKLVNLYNRYSEVPLKENSISKHKVVSTFTSEQVWYDDDSHEYLDCDMAPMLSGSKYAKNFEKPFPSELLSRKIGEKNNISSAVVQAMWKSSGNMSATFGTSLHLAMEHWFNFREVGTDKQYHISKNPFLKKVVETFPLKDADVIPEVMVSCTRYGIVGQIDGLVILGDKKCGIIDYKTDTDLKKSITKHAHQLSFYAFILEQFGWTVEFIDIYNYVNDEWSKHQLKRQQIDVNLFPRDRGEDEVAF